MLTLNTVRPDHELNLLEMKACSDEARRCSSCKLSRSRKHVVFGAGNPSAPIMVIGGPPGYYDDKDGVPLAGKAGHIVRDALHEVGLIPRRDLFCTNIVKCRPRRDPDTNRLKITPKEVAECSDYLSRQIAIVRPAILVLHGGFVSKSLLGDKRSLQQYVGSFRRYGPKAIALCTYNPAGLFGEREPLIEDYILHWRGVASRLNLLGRMWRPDAKCFAEQWTFDEDLGTP